MEVLNFWGVCTFIVVVVVVVVVGGGGGGGGISLFDLICKLSSWLALLCNLHPWLPADGVGAILSHHAHPDMDSWQGKERERVGEGGGGC